MSKHECAAAGCSADAYPDGDISSIVPLCEAHDAKAVERAAGKKSTTCAAAGCSADAYPDGDISSVVPLCEAHDTRAAEQATGVYYPQSADTIACAAPGCSAYADRYSDISGVVPLCAAHNAEAVARATGVYDPVGKKSTTCAAAGCSADAYPDSDISSVVPLCEAHDAEAVEQATLATITSHARAHITHALCAADSSTRDAMATTKKAQEILIRIRDRLASPDDDARMTITATREMLEALMELTGVSMRAHKSAAALVRAARPLVVNENSRLH